jgi:excisionase family DNA binding protein
MHPTPLNGMSVREKLVSFPRPLTASELAETLNVPEQQVYRQARAGEIPSFRVGNTVRFEPRALCAWYDRQ